MHMHGFINDQFRSRFVPLMPSCAISQHTFLHNDWNPAEFYCLLVTTEREREGEGERSRDGKLEQEQLQRSIKTGGRREMLQRMWAGIVTARLLVGRVKDGWREAEREDRETHSGGDSAQSCWLTRLSVYCQTVPERLTFITLISLPPTCFPTLCLHLVFFSASLCFLDSFFKVRCTFLSLLFPSHLHLLHPFLQPFYPIFPSSNHPSIYCISLFLSVLCSHNLKMLLGPQCFASLLSTMINSESVVFCFRQKCCLIVPPTDLPNWAIHIHTVGCSQWWPFWGRGPSAAQECGHVTVDRWVGRREW